MWPHAEFGDEALDFGFGLGLVRSHGFPFIP
jgi:hypothetical protein